MAQNKKIRSYMEGKEMSRITDFSGIFNETWTEVTTIDWNGTELCVRRFLPLDNAVALIDAVVASCFSKDTGDYIPAIRDLAEKIAMVASYTNIDVPEDGGSQYRLVYQTDIIDVIEENADNAQYKDIMSAIADGIKSRQIANKDKFDIQVAGMFNKISEFVDNISDALGGVSRDTIAEFVDAVIKNGIDEGRILDAVIAAESGANNGSES